MSRARVAALLALTLLISIIAVLAPAKRSTGFLVDIAKAQDTGCLDDRRILVAILHSNHMVQLNNSEAMELADLRAMLQKIFATRATRLLFIEADPDISFQEFIDLIDTVRWEVDKFSLVTPEVKARVGGCIALVPGCWVCTPAKPTPATPWFTGVRVE